jgi:phosphoglycerate kinase
MNGAFRTAWSTPPAPWRGSAEHGVQDPRRPGEVTGKRALVRVDLNVPMQDGAVSDDTRLRATLPTVTELADRARSCCCSRISAAQGRARPDMSLSLVTRPMSRCWARRCASSATAPGERPRRSHAAGRHRDPGEYPLPRRRGEERPELARAMAALGDFYVNDAFLRRAPRPRLDRGLARCCRLMPAGRWKRS